MSLFGRRIGSGERLKKVEEEGEKLYDDGTLGLQEKSLEEKLKISIEEKEEEKKEILKRIEDAVKKGWDEVVQDERVRLVAVEEELNNLRIGNS